MAIIEWPVELSKVEQGEKITEKKPNAKATYYRVPAIGHSGRGRTMETVK